MTTNSQSSKHQFDLLLLTGCSEQEKLANPGNLKQRAADIESILAKHNIHGKFTRIDIGPRVSKCYFTADSVEDIIRAEKQHDQIEDDIRGKLKTTAKHSGVRIVADPYQNNFFVEIPHISPARVYLRDLLANHKFDDYAAANQLAFAIGVDGAGEPIYSNLDHSNLLIAGDQFSGKATAVSDIITSLVYQFSPSNLGLAIFDATGAQLSQFANLPHLLKPIISPEAKGLDKIEEETEYKLRDTVKQIYDKINHRKAGQEHISTASRHIVLVLYLANNYINHNADTSKYLSAIIEQGPAVGVHVIIADEFYRKTNYILADSRALLASFNTRIALTMTRQSSSLFIPGTDTTQLLKMGDGTIVTPDHPGPQRFQSACVDRSDVEAIAKSLSNH